MSFTFPCHQCKEKVTMIIGVQVCGNCGKGYWLKEKNGVWQNEDNFLVTDDGNYLVVPIDLDFGKSSLRGRILSRLRRLLDKAIGDK